MCPSCPIWPFDRSPFREAVFAVVAWRHPRHEPLVEAGQLLQFADALLVPFLGRKAVEIVQGLRRREYPTVEKTGRQLWLFELALRFDVITQLLFEAQDLRAQQ